MDEGKRKVRGWQGTRKLMCSPTKALSVTWGPLATATKCPSGWKASEMMEKSKRMTFTQQLRAMLHTRT